MASNQPSSEDRNEDPGKAPVAGSEGGVELSEIDVASDGTLISQEVVAANPDAGAGDPDLAKGEVLLSNPQLSPEEIKALGLDPLLVAAPVANEVHTISSDEVAPSAELPDGDLKDAGVRELEGGSLVSVADGPVDQTIVQASGDGAGSEVFNANPELTEGDEPVLDLGEPQIVSPPSDPENVHTARSDDPVIQAGEGGDGPVDGSGPGDGNSPSDGTGVLTNDRSNTPRSVTDSKGDLTGLLNISEVTADSLEERLDGSALEFSVNPTPDITIEPGMVKEASVTICDGIATVKLTFEGNNLAAGTDGDSTIEFGFGPVEGDTQAMVIHDRLTDILNSQTAENSTLTTGTSITEHTAVTELLQTITAEAEFNSAVTSVNASNTLIKIEPNGEQIFKDAVLGGTNGVQGVLNPDIAETTASLSKVEIEGVQFAGLAGNIEDSTLKRVSVLNGDISVNTDDSSKLDLIARGSSIHGTFNCELSGDYRGANLGSKERPISGSTFTLENGQLNLGSPPKLKNFVIDLEPNAEGNMQFKLNEDKIGLSSLGSKVRKVNLDTVQPTGSPLSYLRGQHPVRDVEALLSRLNVEDSSFSDNPIFAPAGSFDIDIMLKDQNGQSIDIQRSQNSPQPVATVDLKLTRRDSPAGTDPATATQEIQGITPDRALYIMNQLQRMDADADLAALQVKIGAGATPFNPPVNRDDLEEIDSGEDPSADRTQSPEPVQAGEAGVINLDDDKLDTDQD